MPLFFIFIMTSTINWDDGSNDKIYLNYSAATGNQNITITSDVNNNYSTRTKDITFSTAAGSTTITRVLTVSQTGQDITIIKYNDTYITSNDTAIGYK